MKFYATSALATLALTAALGCEVQTPALSITTTDAPAASADEGERVAQQATPKKRTKKTKKKSSKRSKATQRNQRASARQPVGDAPPVHTRASVPGARVESRAGPGGVHMQMNVEDETGSHSATVSVQGGMLPGMGVQMDVRERVVVEQRRAAPAPRQRRRASTCKAAVLANGHASSSLIHCGSDVNDRCAVALLNAGHNPSVLVHCSDISDVGCAVQMMESGRNPAEIVHCD